MEDRAECPAFHFHSLQTPASCISQLEKARTLTPENSSKDQSHGPIQAFEWLLVASLPSQLYPLRLDATLVPCIGTQLVGSVWASWPHLILFPAQGRPRSWPVILHCSSPGQQVLLGDVVVRLCMAVDRVLCWHGHVFSCLGDICPLGCHNSSFFCCGTMGSPSPPRSTEKWLRCASQTHCGSCAEITLGSVVSDPSLCKISNFPKRLHFARSISSIFAFSVLLHFKDSGLYLHGQVKGTICLLSCSTD